MRGGSSISRCNNNTGNCPPNEKRGSGIFCQPENKGNEDELSLSWVGGGDYTTLLSGFGRAWSLARVIRLIVQQVPQLELAQQVP